MLHGFARATPVPFLPPIRAVCKVLGLQHALWVLRGLTRAAELRPWVYSRVPGTLALCELRSEPSAYGRLAQVHRHPHLRVISWSSSSRTVRVRSWSRASELLFRDLTFQCVRREDRCRVRVVLLDSVLCELPDLEAEGRNIYVFPSFEFECDQRSG